MMSKKTKNHLLLVAIATLPLLFAANSEGMYTKTAPNPQKKDSQESAPVLKCIPLKDDFNINKPEDRTWFEEQLKLKYKCGGIRDQLDKFLKSSKNLELFEELVRLSQLPDYTNRYIELEELIELSNSLSESDRKDYLLELADIGCHKYGVNNIIEALQKRPACLDMKELLDAFHLFTLIGKEYNFAPIYLTRNFFRLPNNYPSGNLKLYEKLVRICG